MSINLIIVVLIVGVLLIALFGCLVMIVITLTRLRGVLKLQFETIEKLVSQTRAEQSRDEPTESS